MTASDPAVRGLPEPEEHDYPAAGAYLQLIADGYHRVCASHHTDENTDISCRIAAPPAGSAR